MDEYLTDEDVWIDIEHPLSFRGFMNRLFYDRVNPELAPRHANRVFPDPFDRDAIRQLIDMRGGVDVCFGGIGINGHIAIGGGARIAAQAGVFGDVPAGAEYLGWPARPRAEALRRYAHVERLPQLQERLKELERRIAELEDRRG